MVGLKRTSGPNLRGGRGVCVQKQPAFDGGNPPDGIASGEFKANNKRGVIFLWIMEDQLRLALPNKHATKRLIIDTKHNTH